MTLFPKSQEWRVRRFLEQRIQELEAAGPCGHRFHIKRYLETFRWLPKEPARLIDLGGACGLFEEVLKEFSQHQLFTADHLSERAEQCFDFEKDRFPFDEASFDIVLFTEVLEHLREDPMHALAEINRILVPGGKLLLSTPNICSWKAIQRALQGEQPGLFVQYMRHGGCDRHNREYSAREVLRLLEAAGFDILRADAIDVYEHLPVAEPLAGYDPSLRGDTTFCLAQKNGPLRERMPNWLYWPTEG